MSFAIEVLKANIPKYYSFIKPMKLTKGGKYVPDNSEEEFWNAVKEALLALEQKEKLIKLCNELEAMNESEISKTMFGALIGTCKVKEVLGELK
jgi:hypothetical protein